MGWPYQDTKLQVQSQSNKTCGYVLLVFKKGQKTINTTESSKTDPCWNGNLGKNQGGFINHWGKEQTVDSAGKTILLYEGKEMRIFSSSQMQKENVNAVIIPTKRKIIW